MSGRPVVWLALLYQSAYGGQVLGMDSFVLVRFKSGSLPQRCNQHGRTNTLSTARCVADRWSFESRFLQRVGPGMLHFLRLRFRLHFLRLR